MTTPPEDPFATPAPIPGQSAAPAPTSPAPASPASADPATTSAAPYSPTPPPVGYRLEPPKSLATATIVLTGLYVALAVITAALSPVTVATLKKGFGGSATATFNITPDQVLSLVVTPVVIASWIVLAVWWGRIRSVRAQGGYQVGGLPAVEWWGWLVPFANFVLPALGMRKLTKGIVGVGPLLGWWLPFCATFIAGALQGAVYVTAIDWGTGELANPTSLDVIVWVSWTSAALLAISWVFLTYIVNKTTKKASA